MARRRNLSFADSTFDVAAMALVISFLPHPDRAVAEMARVVRPGGLAAAYMWDVPRGGVPVHAIYVALESMGIMSVRPPNPAASELGAMQRFWKDAGLERVETHIVRVLTDYRDFDDYWNSNTVPIGPQGKIIAGMSSSAREELRTRLRDLLPISPNGRIAYEVVANCVKGQVPV
jgi:SAM-dependent methyltransferase